MSAVLFNHIKLWARLLALLPMLLPAQGQAQSAKAFAKAGDKAWAGGDYQAAFLHFQNAMSLQPDEVAYWFKYAEAARQFNAWEEADKYFEKVCQHEEARAFPLAHFWLGSVKKSLGQYQEAREHFQHFLAMEAAPATYLQWAAEELEACDWAAGQQSEAGQQISISHLGKNLNSAYSEFGAVKAGQYLYYSSFRFDFPGDKNLPPRKLTKVLRAEDKAKGRPLPNDFNLKDRHTAHTAFSTDGKRLYFTICQYSSASNIRCELYFRNQDRRGRWEKRAVRLPDIINKQGYTSTHPAIGYDSSSCREILFFTSDRNGGKGKLDLWFTYLDEDKFLEPRNLEALNTAENDITPFFHSPSQTLYYSSDRQQPSLGGYDIFLARMDSTSWTHPINAGLPLNSSYHDLYFSIAPDGKEGYLSSNRPGSFFLDDANKACCYDLWQWSLSPAVPPEDPASPPPLVAAPPKPNAPQTLEDFLPLALYFDNDEPDKRTTRTTTKKSYRETYFRYYERRAEYLERYTAPLTEEAAELAALEIEDFFEDSVKRGFEHLELFCQILLQRLETGDTVEIVIKGYTSPRAKSDYNDRLASRRISSLKNQFGIFRDGIFQSHLQDGRLRLSEAPYGETKASGSISDELGDERNSIYHPAAARERRVEIVEVR
jgi:tetratricopeptide (TPR) repeat protein